jgi:hypothetical protein
MTVKVESSENFAGLTSKLSWRVYCTDRATESHLVCHSSAPMHVFTLELQETISYPYDITTSNETKLFEVPRHRPQGDDC